LSQDGDALTLGEPSGRFQPIISPENLKMMALAIQVLASECMFGYSRPSLELGISTPQQTAQCPKFPQPDCPE